MANNNNSTQSPIILHEEDLPIESLRDLSDEVAIDTETLGLNLNRDRLCLVQLKDKASKVVHLIKFTGDNYNAPNLSQLLLNKDIVKVYHYGRFDIAVLFKYLGALSANNFCTKIASALVRTYSSRHGLKELCNELLGVSLNKQQQSSNWGADTLSVEQKMYAANDVLYLSALKEILTKMLNQTKRYPLAESCFRFLPTRSMLDLLGWEQVDIFSHNFSQNF